MITVRCMTHGATYLSRHLCHSDYYDEQRRVQGKWLGTGAEKLGLKAGSPVDAGSLRPTAPEHQPGDGGTADDADEHRPARRRAGSLNRRCFYDVTISAPSRFL